MGTYIKPIPSDTFSGGTVYGETDFLAGVTANTIYTTVLSAETIYGTVISATTFYGDGSNLSGISSDNFYTTAATLNSSILYFDRTDGLSAYFVNLSAFTLDSIFNTHTGNTDIHQTIAQNNARYVNVTGDTMTGDLIMSNGSSGSTVFPAGPYSINYDGLDFGANAAFCTTTYSGSSVPYASLLTYNTSTPQFRFTKRLSGNSGLLINNGIGTIQFRGSDGNPSANFDSLGVNIKVKASENWSSTGHGVTFELKTAANGETSTPTRFAVIDGQIKFNNAYTFPTTAGSTGDFLKLSGDSLMFVDVNDVYVNVSGDTMTGSLILTPGTTITAPLQFQSGPLLTTEISGAIEYLTDDYYANIGLDPYVSQNPPAYTSTYIKATSETVQYEAPYVANPSTSLIGAANWNAWVSVGATANQRLHINLHIAQVITKVYYENLHQDGSLTDAGVQNFTLWGSNTQSDFDDLVYNNDGTWVQLTTDVSVMTRHVDANQADPKYIYVTNTVAYKYYAFKCAANYGSGMAIGLRRVGLQSGGSSPRKGIILNDGTNLTEDYIPVATTNGRLIDSSLQVADIITPTIGDARYVNVTGDTMTGNLEIDGDARISGSLIVSGPVISATTENVLISDNLLTLNYLSGRTDISGVTKGTAGIEIDRGGWQNYLFLFNESTDDFRVGVSGDTQAVATRENSPIVNGFAYWNDSLYRFDTTTALSATSFDYRGEELDARYVNITGDTMTGNLTLTSGSTTVAPLKFVSGVLLTTKEQGAIEFVDDDYYGTIRVADYNGEYPPTQTTSYVKATTTFSTTYSPWFATDPTLPLTGNWKYISWISVNGTNTNQRLHIDLGSSKAITRIYYENGHSSGGFTDTGVKNFTLWGSNTAGDFTDLTYANDGTWVELTCDVNQFEKHSGSDIADPKFVYVTNTTAYQYYAFKIADNWADASEIYMSIRHIELQTGALGGNPRKGIILSDGSNLTDSYIPVATTNGRLIDSSLQVADIITETIGDARYVNITGDTMTGNLSLGTLITFTGGTFISDVSASQFNVGTGNDKQFSFLDTAFQYASASYWAILNEQSSFVNPNIIPDRSFMNTGIGGNPLEVSLIANGVEALRATSAETYIYSGLTVTGGASIEKSLDITTNTSGSSVLNLYGTNGQLFSVTDDLDGELLSINDISGLPIFGVHSDGYSILNSSESYSLTADTGILLYSFSSTTATAGYFDYFVQSGTTLRAGTIMSVWDGTNVEYTESSTSDLGGSTTGVTFSMDISGGNVRLLTDIVSGTWDFKLGARLL